MGFWKSLLFLVPGLAAGMLILLGFRVMHYAYMDFTPEMSPMIAFLFSPLILGELMVVTLPLEAVSRRLSFVPTRRAEAFCIGVAHSSWLSVWAFPPYWWLVFALNPIVLRCLLGIAARKDRSPAMLG